MRDGINFNWDSAANGSVNMIASGDYWYGSPRANAKVGLGDNGTFYKWTTSGTQSTPSLLSMATTFSNASPTVATATAHGLVVNERVVFSGGSLPAAVVAGTVYYAQPLTVNTFNISSTPFPSVTLINTGSTGSGTMASPAWTGTATLASVRTLNNLSIFGSNVSGNYPRKFLGSGSTVRNLGGNAPQAWMFCTHLGRFWANNGATLDRIEFSTTGNPEQWQGDGDSGSLDIGVGDGDPTGITCLFPPFQGVLYVAKQTKLYRIENQTPETFRVVLVSDGIGCVGPNAFATVDQDDIVFVSEKGIHSLVGTINSGDDESKYLSYDIQSTFNSSWTKSRLPSIWGTYLSKINSVQFAVSDSTYSGSASYNNAIWQYNIPLRSWYVWPNIPAQSMFIGTDSDSKRIYFGGNNTRLAKSFNSTNYDVSTTGVNTAISMSVATGVIYFNDNPFVTSGFKKFSLIYSPQGTHTITVNFKIDNYTTQTISFSQSQTGGVLGVSFYLGSSALGYSFVTGPYTQQIDGYGRGFQVTMSQSGIQAPIDIQGFAVEYEEMGPQQETITTG